MAPQRMNGPETSEILNLGITQNRAQVFSDTETPALFNVADALLTVFPSSVLD